MIVLSGGITHRKQEMSSQGQAIFVYDVMFEAKSKTFYVQLKAWRDVKEDEVQTGVTVIPGQVFQGRGCFWLFEDGESTG